MYVLATSQYVFLYSSTNIAFYGIFAGACGEIEILRYMYMYVCSCSFWTRISCLSLGFSVFNSFFAFPFSPLHIFFAAIFYLRLGLLSSSKVSEKASWRENYTFLLKDLERSRLARIFIKITTHLNSQDMFRSCNDHLQLKVELI